MTIEFANKLLEEMGKQGLTQAELARRSGLSKQAISDYVNQRRTNPDTNALKALAKAFKLPVEEVYQWAGVLTDSHEMDSETLEASHLFEQLGPYDRKQVLEDMRRILAQDNYKNIRETQSIYTTEYPAETLELINDFLENLKKEGYKKIK